MGKYYRSNDDRVLVSDLETLYQPAIQWLQAELPADRFNHSLRVAKLAYNLGEFHRIDTPEYAYLAGILHDNAKYKHPDMLHQSGIAKPHCYYDLYAAYPAIWHAFAGPRQVLHITKNRLVLHAMRWHTTGRARLHPIAKLVYLADYCEPGRPASAWRDAIRTLAYRDLDTAIGLCAHRQITQHTLDCFWATQACWRYYRWRPDTWLP